MHRDPEVLTRLVISPARSASDFKDWSGKTFRLEAELKFIDSAGKEHVVPKGVIFNGATTDPGTRVKWFNALVQWVACLFVWPMDKHAEATAFHDYVYTRPSVCIKRNDTDELFRQLLIVCGLPRWKARCMYWFVSRFGKRLWAERVFVF